MISLIFAVLFSQAPATEPVEDPTKDPADFQVLPKGQKCTLKDDSKAFCYPSIDDVKKLSDADDELVILRGKVIVLQEEVDLLRAKTDIQTKIILQKDIIIKTYEANDIILQTQVDRLDKNWKQALRSRTAINIAVLTASTVGALTVGASIGVASTVLVKSIAAR